MNSPEDESNEALEEQAVALYDFLYRDSNRIVSYYAQIFGGKITSQEETDLRRHSKDSSVKGDIKIVSSETKSGRETQSISKRIIDPHDVITSDVLTYLVRSKEINNDIEKAPNGSLVMALGTVGFIEHSMAEMAIITDTTKIFTNFGARGKGETRQKRLAIGML